MDVESLRNELSKYKQDHVLQFWDKLSDSEKETFHRELTAVDLSDVHELFCQANNQSREDLEKKDDLLEPVPAEVFRSTSKVSEEEINAWRDEGLRQVSFGKVGVLLLAGGQGTRLGVTYPKGMYDVGLPSKKTLYQLQAERLLKLQSLAHKQHGREGSITWYIMTSEATRAETEEFFMKHDYFGINSKDVVVFEQHTLPCLTFEGKLMLDGFGRLAKAPDGNGGLYKALKTAKIVDDMEKRGIEYVHVYCVDNILVRIADPVFIGFCLNRKSDCGAKVCEKVEPTESVGIVCKCKGRYQVVEYSEISKTTAEKRTDTGHLVFNAGNICNHFFTVEFLKELLRHHLSALPHHVAKKKIPHINQKGERIKPDSPNGMKLEKFVFDVFQFSERFSVLEVLREDEFSPLKNGPSAEKDSPVSCKKHLLNLHARCVSKAGGEFVDNNGKVIIPDKHTSDIQCEVSPLLSYSGEGLHETVNGRKFAASEVVHLTSEQEDSKSDQCSNGDEPAEKKTKVD